MEPLGRLFPLFESTAVSVRVNSSNGRQPACGDAMPLLGAAWWAADAMRWRGDGGDVVVRSELNGDETRGATQQQGTAREGGAVQRDAGRARAGSTAAEGARLCALGRRDSRAEVLLSLGSRMDSFRHVDRGRVWLVAVLKCPRVDRPPCPNQIHPLALAPSAAPMTPATASPPNPTPPRPSCRPPAQYMPIARPLQFTLLHPGQSASVSLAFVQTTCARAMSTKPSLAAAEDFLSFVNASPTRMLALCTVSAWTIIDPSSFPCRQVGQRKIRKGGLQADSGMCKLSRGTTTTLGPHAHCAELHG
jgi:hypothetical protein